MNHISIKQMIIVYSAIILLVILNSIIPGIFVYHNIENVPVKVESFTDGERDLSPRLRQADEPFLKTYNATIDGDDIRGLDDGDLGLSITRLEAQGYNVWWNDTYLGYAGDPINGRANIWVGSYWFTIPKQEIRDVNNLTLEIYAEYDIGANENSVLITDIKDAKAVTIRHRTFSSSLSLVGMGIAVFAVIITFGLAVIKTKSRRVLIAMTAGMVLISIYSMDYLNAAALPFAYLTFKRIIMSAAFLGIACFGLAVTWLINHRLPAISSIIMAGIFVIGMFFMPNMLMFKKYYNVAMVMLPVILGIWAAVLIPRLKTQDEARILFGSILIMLVIGMWEVLALTFFPNDLSITQISMILVIAALMTFVIALDRMQTDTMLSEEISNNLNLINQSKLDALSGLFNKAHFIALLKNKREPYSVAMCDIDDFKEINDTYGHVSGDSAIRHVADIIKQELREGDIVARYGGDEYAAVVACSADTAVSIFERVRRSINNVPLIRDGQEINMTISIGIYHVRDAQATEVIVNNADKALYHAKRTGKNRTVIYKKGH